MLQMLDCFRLNNTAHWAELIPVMICALFLSGLFWYLTLRICLDLTNRVWRRKLRAERALREAAQEADRAKTEFLANLSHEIRAPLNAIIQFTELAPHTSLSGDLEEHLGVVRTSSGWLIHIMNDVLEFSRSRARAVRLESEAFSLRECMGSAVQMIEKQAKARGLVVRSRIDPEIPFQLRGDFTRLLQVIFNLLENAVQWTTTGGVMLTAEAMRGKGPAVTWR